MKKSLIFLMLIVSILFCACAKKMNKGQENDSTVQEELPQLVWWTVGDEPKDYEEGMETINTYLRDKLQIQLDIRYVKWADWTEKTAELMNGTEEFDLMFVDATYFAQGVSTGTFQDITDLIHTYSPKLWTVMPEFIWAGGRSDGRIYAVPTYKDSALSQYWIFDKQYIDKYEIDISKINTFEDLDRYFRFLKKNEGDDFYPLLMSRGENFNLFGEYDSFNSGLSMIGVRPDDTERKVICFLEDEIELEKMSYLRQWYLDGIINPDADKIKTVPESRSFLQGNSWPGSEEVWEQSEKIDEVVMKKVFGPVYSRDSIQGSMNAVSARSKYKEEALKLLELVNTDRKLRDMLAYGVEGENFEYVNDTQIERLDKNWNVYAYTQGNFFVMSSEGNGSWEDLQKSNEMAEKSVLLDFEMDLSELEVEMETCKKIWHEYAFQFATGTADLEIAIPECLERLKANGLDIIISEAQKQIDAYYMQ